jgi:WhiB family redox-sensing transcriptional regulator
MKSMEHPAPVVARQLREDSPPEWHLRAACQYTDPELFFPDGGGPAAAAAVQADQARGVCASCPVRRNCLTHALRGPELYGIWGGLSERELRAERRRPVPRAAEVIMAAADARYLRRRRRQAAADERADQAERRQRQLDAFLGLAA